MPAPQRIIYAWTIGLALTIACAASAADRYVSTSGLDTNPGTLAQPWRTIQKAANTVVAGDVVHIRAGTYAERVTINNRDGTNVSPIVFQKYASDSGAVIVDQTGVTPPNGDSALLRINNSDYITVQNMEFSNLKTAGTPAAQKLQLPSGIYINGNGNGIKILNCKVHGIWQSCTDLYDFDANGFGIAVYGRDSTGITNLTIDGCEIYNLRTGASESMVLNGNVTNFVVSNNKVHDCNNIGIDIIGYEGSAPTAVDRARNGVVSGNTVYNVDSSFNPAYGGNLTTGGGDRSAAGIYVDGGTQVVIERNHVFRCNFGVELASEHASGFTDYITLRNNLLHHNHITGLIMGGYDRLRGQTRYCTITGNTFYRNDTDSTWTGQIALQFYVNNCAFKNNIVWASGQKQFLIHWPGDDEANAAQKEIGANVTLDYNRYFCSSGNEGDLEFSVFKNGAQRSFSSLALWKTSANGLQADANSTYSTPGFTTATPGAPAANPTDTDLANIRAQFVLLANSTAVNAGDPAYTAASGELDFFGQGRVVGGRVDIGADEVGTSWSSWRTIHFGPTPGANSGPTDDPDKDGATNLMEYSQGMNPNVSDASLLPSATKSGNNLRFSFKKMASDLTYTVQQNTTLPGTWATLNTTGSSGDLFWCDVSLGGAQRFFRLVVTLP